MSTGTKRTSPFKYVKYRRLVDDGAGGLCWRYAYRRAESAGTNDGIYPNTPDGDAALADYSQCPVSAAAAPTTPAEFAINFWQDVPLPSPQPSIAPGRAVTGLTAYLETNGSTEASFTSDTPLGPMEVTATATYFVDWGDGSHGGPYEFEGDPWPDGAITHEYQRVGSYNVVVDEHWVATWRLGDQTGTLDELRTSGTIPNFPVGQIQAVISR